MSSPQLAPRGRTQTERLLWTAMFARGARGRRGLPIVVRGKPGVGKTSIIGQLCRQAGLGFYDVIASLREPSDFLGLPIPTQMKLSGPSQILSPDGEDEATIVRYAPADFAVKAAIAGRAMIFLDEVNTASMPVQTALLRLINEGVCGELELPPGVRFMLAMNKTEDAAGGWDIAPPLANRLGWLDAAEPDVQLFADFLQNDGANATTPVNARDVETEVDALWPNAWATNAGQLAGFLQSNSAALLRMPPPGSPEVSGAWPSPRSHELAARARAAADIFGLSPIEKNNLTCGFIGQATASELYDWVKANDLPDPSKLLDGLVQWQHNPQRLDRTAAVITSCTSLVVREGVKSSDPVQQAVLDAQQKARVEALWGIHDDLSSKAPHLALGSVVSMCNARLMLGSRKAYGVLAKMEPVMAAAGVTPESAKA
jgi:hypothetical protein